MMRRCFMVDHAVSVNDELVLGDDAAHHLRAVLRMNAGDQIELRDGVGGAWEGTIVSFAPSEVLVRIDKTRNHHNESQLNLTVVLAYAQADRMDLVMRQATELGVSRLVAFQAARSQYGLTGAKAAKRKDRWSKIARQALCQCGRVRLPEIVMACDIGSVVKSSPVWLGDDDKNLKIVAWEDERQQGLLRIWEKLPICRNMMIVIGPEGGFTQEEVNMFAGAQFRTVQFGPRILRLETAAASLITAVQLLWGDLGAAQRLVE